MVEKRGSALKYLIRQENKALKGQPCWFNKTIDSIDPEDAKTVIEVLLDDAETKLIENTHLENEDFANHTKINEFVAQEALDSYRRILDVALQYGIATRSLTPLQLSKILQQDLP